MKQILYIVIIVLNFSSCKAQKKAKMEQDIIIPEITNEFEKFDIKIFNEQVDIISGKRIIRDKETYLEEDFQDPGYARVEYLEDSFYYTMKLFYNNGSISKKGNLFNNGSEYGIWYEFNEEGKLIKEINTDEGYTFSWKEIIAYCIDKKIELIKGVPKGGFNTSIYKRELEGKKVWVISYLLPVGDTVKEITLDGETGKEIKQREINFIGG